MTHRHLVPFFFLIGFILASVTTAAQERKALSAEEIYARSIKSIVKIETENGSGTGFFAKDGRLYTAAHVIQDAAEIEVIFSDGFKTSVYTVAGLDKDADIAVLQTSAYEGWEKRETGPEFGEYEKVKTGETVYVIGNPRGLDFSITQGLVSAKRKLEDREVMQISAGSTYGSSGSPVFNKFGDIVGIVTSGIEDAAQLNFASTGDDLKNLQGVSIFDLAQSKDVILILGDEAKASFKRFRSEADVLNQKLKNLSELLTKLGYKVLEKKLTSSKDENVLKNGVSDLLSTGADVANLAKSLGISTEGMFMSSLIYAFEYADECQDKAINILPILGKKHPTYTKEIDAQLNDCFNQARRFVAATKILWLNIQFQD